MRLWWHPLKRSTQLTACLWKSRSGHADWYLPRASFFQGSLSLSPVGKWKNCACLGKGTCTPQSMVGWHGKDGEGLCLRGPKIWEIVSTPSMLVMLWGLVYSPKIPGLTLWWCVLFWCLREGSVKNRRHFWHYFPTRSATKINGRIWDFVISEHHFYLFTEHRPVLGGICLTVLFCLYLFLGHRSHHARQNQLPPWQK